MANTTQGNQQYQYSDPDQGGRSEQAGGGQGSQLGGGLQNVNQNVMQFLRDRPAAAMLGAVAAGFVVGRIFSRK